MALLPRPARTTESLVLAITSRLIIHKNTQPVSPLHTRPDGSRAAGLHLKNNSVTNTFCLSATNIPRRPLSLSFSFCDLIRRVWGVFDFCDYFFFFFPGTTRAALAVLPRYYKNETSPSGWRPRWEALQQPQLLQTPTALAFQSGPFEKTSPEIHPSRRPPDPIRDLTASGGVPSAPSKKTPTE